eukprot:92791-Amphidinium_carterae.1
MCMELLWPLHRSSVQKGRQFQHSALNVCSNFTAQLLRNVVLDDSKDRLTILSTSEEMLTGDAERLRVRGCSIQASSVGAAELRLVWRRSDVLIQHARVLGGL